MPLREVVNDRIFLGIKTGLNEAFELTDAQRATVVATDPGAAALIRPFLGGQDIRRYFAEALERFLIAIPFGFTRSRMGSDGNVDEKRAWRWFLSAFPGVAAHIAPFAEAAKRRTDQGEFWWELRPCDYYGVLDGSKIIYPDITKGPRFHLDEGNAWIRNTAYCLDSHDPYLLGLLNSRLLWFCVARVSIPFGTRAGEYRYRLFTQHVSDLPIVAKPPVAKKRKMIELAEEMRSLRRRQGGVENPHQLDRLRREIDATDRRIDQLVYQLYDLTDEEIRIVEAATAAPGRDSEPAQPTPGSEL